MEIIAALCVWPCVKGKDPNTSPSAAHALSPPRVIGNLCPHLRQLRLFGFCQKTAARVWNWVAKQNRLIGSERRRLYNGCVYREAAAQRRPAGLRSCYEDGFRNTGSYEWKVQNIPHMQALKRSVINIILACSGGFHSPVVQGSFHQDFLPSKIRKSWWKILSGATWNFLARAQSDLEIWWLSSINRLSAASLQKKAGISKENTPNVLFIYRESYQAFSPFHAGVEKKGCDIISAAFLRDW